MGFSQRYRKGHQSALVSIDVHDIVLVALADGVQHYAFKLLIHAANLLIIRQSRVTKVQKTQLFPHFGGLNFVNSKNSSNFAVAFAENSRNPAHSSIG